MTKKKTEMETLIEEAGRSPRDDGSHGQSAGPRPHIKSFSADDIGDFGDGSPKSGFDETGARRDHALLGWIMRDRIRTCECRICEGRRILLALPARLSGQLGTMFAPAIINTEVARVLGEISDMEISHKHSRAEQALGIACEGEDPIPF